MYASRHRRRVVALLLVLLLAGAGLAAAEPQPDADRQANESSLSLEMQNAFEEVKQAAKKGDAEAQLRLAMFYFAGEMGAAQDYDLALHWFRQAAGKGNTEAMYHLGLAYERGLGVDVNLIEAMGWFRQAAAGGSVLALRAAGRLLRGPTAARQQQLEADMLQYRELAATTLDPDQVTEYREKMEAARRYLEQSQAIRDLALAVQYFQQAGARGDAWSRREHGRALLLGRGIEADPRQALELLEPLARGGDLEAQLLCADAWSGRYPPVPADHEKMFDYLWQAAAVEETPEKLPIVAEAMTKIAWCYENGIHVAADPALAAKWYEKAAERGSAPAMINLGHRLARGEDGPRDERAAFEWYRRAARADHPLAWFNLGVCWAEGRGVAPDDAAALKAFRIAANQGILAAQYNLARFYLEGRGGEPQPARAVRWFKEAAERGDGVAMVDLALCYLEGTGTDVDRERARQWLEQAARLQAPMAGELLARHFAPPGE